MFRHSLNPRPKWLIVAAILSLGIVPSWAMAQCDVPLEVQQGSVPPNVLIVLDTSGSMNTIITHEDYDYKITWSGPFDSNDKYRVSSAGLKSPSSFNSTWDTSPTAPLTPSDLGRDGQYDGNYLNWVFYHATDAQRAALPQISRIHAGRAAVSAVLQAAPGLRYGLMTFNGDTGGALQAPIGSSEATISSIANTIDADGYTPSAETMLDALKHFQNDGWIQYDCQQNFIVFITDGYPTHDLNIPSWVGDQDGDGREPGNCASIGAPDANSNNCSDYLDDVAYYMAHNDIDSSLDGDQFIYTYTIGFGIDAPLLADTAINGEGLYQSAWNLQSLTQSLGTVVGDIVNRISAGAAVAVTSSEQTEGHTLFRGKFMPGVWRGWFEAHDLPYNQNAPARWEAGQLLATRSADSRTIYTGINGSLVSFDQSNTDALDSYLYGGIYNASDSAQDAILANLVNYIRGEDIAGMRDRGGWKLGDLVHSTPVVVGRPAYFYLDPGYQQFLINNENREPVAYVGANDGMLHAFRVSDGYELWDYIPRVVLPKLDQLADPDYCHQAYVDLSPKAYDVKLNGSWHTVLIGGERTGGDSWFALDVTNPNSPQLLWETSVPEIISSFSEPLLIHTKHFGPLLWSGGGKDAMGRSRFAVLSMETGNLVKWGYYSEGAAGNLASPPVAVDMDFDGYDDWLYQGELSGDLWRWDLGSATLDADNPVVVFEGNQPIQARPALSTDVNGKVLIYFGTGQYLDSGDLLDTTQQSLYCVRDDPAASTTSTRSDLLDQTSAISLTEGGPGWFVDLTQQSGERMTQPALVLDGVVYASSFAPSDEPCSAGGHSWLYRLNYRNGSNPREGHDDTSDRVEDIGQGVASQPVADLTEGNLIVQTSDARLNVMALTTRSPRIQVRSWKETFPASQGGTDPTSTQTP